jgi:cephalosporin hydroxylase
MEDGLAVPLRNILQIIGNGILGKTKYFGVWTMKSPMDSWVYQEIIYETQPDVIIEIGNFNGGSTLFLAHLCDLLGKGRVIGLDLSHETVPEFIKNHPRITLIEGDACQRLDDVKKIISNEERVLVIEDSSHTYDNTLNVLRAYSTFIKPGDYLIVEDSIIHHGLDHGPDPGPYEAITTFIAENEDFMIDRDREHFFITWNPKGYLKRISSNAIPVYTDYPKRTMMRIDKSSILNILRLFVPPIIIHLIGKLRSLKQ